MDLGKIINDELTQKIKDEIVTDDLIATRALIESIRQDEDITERGTSFNIYAESYILELRDGNQKEPTLQDIETWLVAKGLDTTMDAVTVYNSILENGTTWDRIGGVKGLKDILNEQNLQRVMNLAVTEMSTNILKDIKWL